MTRYIKIGVLITFGSLAAILFMMETAETASGGDSYIVSAYLVDATGLLPESKVRVYGVEVGNVKGIHLDKGAARVDLEVTKAIPLFEDAVFEKRMESLLGTASVSIVPGSPEKKRLKDGDVIHQVQSGTAMEQTFENLKNVSNAGKDIVQEAIALFTGDLDDQEQLARYLTDKDSRANKTLLELRESFYTLNLMLKDMQKITYQLSSRSNNDLDQFNKMMTAMTQLSINLNEMVVKKESQLDRSMASIEKSLELIALQLESSQEILKDMAEITSDIGNGEGSIGKLVQDDELYERVISLTKEAEDTLKSTIGIDLAVDYQGNYLINQGAARNQVGVKLTPGRGDKYYSLGMVSGPTTGTTVTTTRATTPSSDPTEIVETTEGWVPFLQLAYNFGPITMRGGLIDGEGGMGLDFNPTDYASLSAEAFDFSSTQSPHLRIYGTLFPLAPVTAEAPFSWIYLNGGVDDLFGSQQMDYFFGGGLRFEDNDLKGLASFVPF